MGNNREMGKRTRSPPRHEPPFLSHPCRSQVSTLIPTFCLFFMCLTLGERASSPLLNHPVRTSLWALSAWHGEGAGQAAVTRPLPWELAARSGSGTKDPLAACRLLPVCRLPLLPASGFPCGRGRRSQAKGRQEADAASKLGPVSRVLSQGPFAAAAIRRDEYEHGAAPGRGSLVPASGPDTDGTVRPSTSTAWSQLPQRPQRLPHPSRLWSGPQLSSWPPPPPLPPPAPLPPPLPPFRLRPQPRPRSEPQPRPLPCQPRPRPGPRPRRPSHRYDAAQLHPDFRGAAVRRRGTGHLPRPARQRGAPALPTRLPPLRPRLRPHLPGPGRGHVPGAAQP